MRKAAPFYLLLMLLQLPAFAEDPAARPDQSKPTADSKPADKAAPSTDLFDFADGKKGSGPNEEQFLNLDESIKLRVEPICRSAVVDRVVETTTIFCHTTGAVRVEIFVEPVDAPFCGKSQGEPRLIGQSKDARRNFPIVWEGTESSRYVKLYAFAYKPGGAPRMRSRSIDLSMGGLRLQVPAAP